jgi:hypothetical protein
LGSAGRDTPQTRDSLSKMPIGVRAAKRGLPPIPAFGIGWLYPVCLWAGTPSFRCRADDISIMQGSSRPTGASAADPLVRPTNP